MSYLSYGHPDYAGDSMIKACKSTRDWMEKKWQEKGCDFPLRPSQWDKNYNGTTDKEKAQSKPEQASKRA